MNRIDLSACAVAFKEWAVICAALGSGHQSLILRKGGISEGRAGFRVAHREFWLLPTQFHAAPEALTPTAAQLLEEDCLGLAPTDDAFYIRLYTRVEEAIELRDEAAAHALAGLHGWSEETIRNRFHYKQPGLFLLLTRVYASQRTLKVLNTRNIAGCKSWVDLPDAIDTFELTPVLSDEAFRTLCDTVHGRLRAAGRAVQVVNS